MVNVTTPDSFFKTWKHSLIDDFQQNGVPAAYAADPWVSEVDRIRLNRDDTRVAALSPDNALIAAAVGREICVYDAGTGELLHTFHGHAGYIRALEFHPGGRKLASGSSINGWDREELVRVWELDGAKKSGEHLQEAATAATAAAAPILLRQWSPADLESANLQKEIAEIILAGQTAVDVRTGRAFTGTLPNFEARAFSCDGQSLLYLPNRTTVAVLDVATLTERFRLAGHTDAIMWAETSPNDSVIATSSWDKTVRLWSMASGETLHILRGATNQSWAGAFSPDGAVIAAGAGKGSVRIWRVDTGELLHTLGGFQDWVRSLSFSPDGLHLAAGASGGTLRVFNVKSGESEQKWQIDVTTPSASSYTEIHAVQYTSRGDLFFSSAEGRIFGYRESQNSKWEFFEGGPPYGPFRRVVTSVEGSKLVAALGSNICIWKID
ncbi:quinon protein alcohol dehydrogenase-like superfamily [Mycena vulgaris]|nr:quinon protein alcohol dehydrogenase-like superfamily [Mycena vulgaris]